MNSTLGTEDGDGDGDSDGDGDGDGDGVWEMVSNAASFFMTGLCPIYTLGTAMRRPSYMKMSSGVLRNVLWHFHEVHVHRNNTFKIFFVLTLSSSATCCVTLSSSHS